MRFVSAAVAAFAVSAVPANAAYVLFQIEAITSGYDVTSPSSSINRTNVFTTASAVLDTELQPGLQVFNGTYVSAGGMNASFASEIRRGGYQIDGDFTLSGDFSLLLSGQISSLSGASSDFVLFDSNPRGGIYTYRAGRATLTATLLPSDYSGRTGLTSASPGIPEPATWAMMIAGFGLVGLLSRRAARTASRKQLL